MTLNEIRQALEDRNIPEVAKRCGMHPNTLRRFLSGKKPSTLTQHALSNYLQQEAKRIAK